MADKSGTGNVRKLHTRSCGKQAACTCQTGSRSRTHRAPCPRAERCRCNGRWQARLMVNTVAVTAPSTFASKGDAEAWLVAERKRAEDVETYLPPPARHEAAERARKAAAKPTFAAYAEQWCERRRVRGRPLAARTKASNADYLRRFLNPTFGDIPIDQITFTMVDDWYHLLCPNHPNQRAKVYSFARAVMNTATSMGGPTPGAGNPFAIRGAGAAETASRHEHVFSDTERQALVKHMRDDRKAMILLALWCGLRYGEIAALRRSDLDLSRGIVKVRRSVAFPPATDPIEKEPKSTAGVRDARIPASVIPDIRRHLNTYVTGREGLLFPADDGGYLRPVSFYGKRTADGWYGALKAAGRWEKDPKKRPHFHDLRATGATEVARVTRNVAEVQRWLGDSTPQAAMRYMRATDGAMDEIADKLSDVALRSRGA
ncbi:MAG: site-specific integrase [Marmoricola sp.]